MCEKKNILIVSAVFPPEQVVSARISKDIAEALATNHCVVVICPEPSRPFGFKFKDTNVEYKFLVKRLKTYLNASSGLLGRIRESYSFGKASAKYIRNNKHKIKLIYVNTWPILAQLATIRAARSQRIPVVTHVQDVYPESLITKFPILTELLMLLLLPVDRLIFQKSTKIIAISEGMKYYLANTRKLSLENIAVIYNWQDENEYISINPEDIPFETDLFTFMYLGNIGPVAGIDFLIDSFIDADLDDAQLIIAGSGSKKVMLQNYVLKQNKSNILFVDVPEGRVADFQSKADVMLLPLKSGVASSSIPSKLPSYMLSKKPIIASVDANSDTARIIKESNSGWFIPAEDRNKMKIAMQSAIKTDREELSVKGYYGYNYALLNLSKNKNLQKVCYTLENCLLKPDY